MPNSRSLINTSGEFLAADAKIKTTLGWKSVSTLQPNDVITTRTGNMSVVVELYPKGICETLRLHFENGRYADSRYKRIQLKK